MDLSGSLSAAVMTIKFLAESLADHSSLSLSLSLSLCLSASDCLLLLANQGLVGRAVISLRSEG